MTLTTRQIEIRKIDDTTELLAGKELIISLNGDIITNGTYMGRINTANKGWSSFDIEFKLVNKRIISMIAVYREQKETNKLTIQASLCHQYFCKYLLCGKKGGNTFFI